MGNRMVKRRARLAARQKWFDALSEREKDSLRSVGLMYHRPGSLSGRK